MRMGLTFRDGEPMEETKITGRLPNLDVEFTRRQSPEGDAETITLRMTAAPSFEAVSEHLMKPGAFPFVAPGPALMLSLWTNPMANPWLAWTRMVQAAWMPALQQTARAVTEQGGDEEVQES